jgi:hypothetical protein
MAETFLGHQDLRGAAGMAVYPQSLFLTAD